VDFQAPNVIDGGDPVLNFPGRIFDAERRGYYFEIIGKRNRCKIFRLIEEPDVEGGTAELSRGDGLSTPAATSPSGWVASPASLSVEPRLFEPPPMSHYQEAA
jgi:hypothetical protein